MNRKLKSISFFLSVSLFFCSCSSQQYFFDASSRERQKELRKSRSGNVFTDVGLMLASMFVMATLEVDAGIFPEGQEFKKLKLINPTTDTIYVNMLTDVYWDYEDFCDFMDIRIPPNEKCPILVPVNANYNVYFSNTPDEEDDEMLQINTDDFKRLSLYPGLTKIDVLNQNQ